MPFYEYQCSGCGQHHEELQKVSARPLRKCPACGRATLKRLVSAPVFRLKGGGWYETDFKNDKDSQRNIAGEKETPVEKPKEDKAEAKPAEKKPDADTTAKPASEAKKPEATKSRRKSKTKTKPKPAAARRRRSARR